MNETPLISVITAVRNGAPYLRELIESVLRQDYPHFEHIVIDDGSTDGGATVTILQQYPHLRWWSRENKGQYATQNEALSSTKGEIVSVISADDCSDCDGERAKQHQQGRSRIILCGLHRRGDAEVKESLPPLPLIVCEKERGVNCADGGACPCRRAKPRI